MKIVKQKNNLNISFPFNSSIIEIIRNFESRKFNNKTKEWSVPVVHVIKILDKLVPLGFSASKEVRDEYDKAIKKKRKIEKILTGEFNNKEKKLINNTKLPLFNFQQIGTGFLCVTQSALLGDEPGLGKTIQSLATVIINCASKILIICPNTLKKNWEDEIHKWLKNASSIIIQGTKKQREQQWEKDVRFYIMNYELLLREIEEIKNIKWDYIIADESTRISNPQTKQSKLIKKINATHRLALTGTPLGNSIQDIWNILDFCQPGLLGNYWNFTEKYCIKNHWRAIIGYKNLSELKRHVTAFMIRRKKIEVLQELPEKLYETIYIELTYTERKIYNAVKNEITEELKKYEINDRINDKYLSNILVKMVRLKQVVDSAELISDTSFSSKIEALKELLNDILYNDSKVIIFTQFAKMSEILQRELIKYKPLLYNGKTSNENRHIIVKQFNNNNINKALIMTDAGSYGLNLQKANYVIHFDLPWSLSKLEQREGRAHRIGQKNALTVYKLIVQNSIDEYIIKVLEKKRKLSNEILGDKERLRKIKFTKRDITELLR